MNSNSRNSAVRRTAGVRPVAGGRPDGVAWIVGIENAFIPDMKVDELGWTMHRDRWKEDLALVRESGATMVRYGITWPEIETGDGQYDWRWTDAAVAELERLGIEPIWDLVHFGTPPYLARGFYDERFPAALHRFAREFARRYRGSVRKITPLNEPYITTYFRAGWGIWPPKREGRREFVRLLAAIVDGVRSAIRAIKDADAGIEIWQNDGADFFHPVSDPTGEGATGAPSEALVEIAHRRTQERYAAYDLLLGLAVPGQESYEWLLRDGYPEADTRESSVPIDVIGLDYYPDTEHDIWLTREIDMGVAMRDDGEAMRATAQRRAAKPFGVAQTARTYFDRYSLPIFVAESSANGSDETRADWLRYNMSEISSARADGVPVVGYTWWPLFDHIDWNTLLREQTGFVCDSGLYHLRPTKRHREPTPAADLFRSLAASPQPGRTGDAT